ncbi:hypothetical protein IJ182_03055 [bacterium]|nr:hypothetical protein [bacterium]
MAKVKTNNITVETSATVNGTKNNDVFHITSTTGDATIIAGNKGTDTLYFDNEIVSVRPNIMADSKDLHINYTLSGSSEPCTIIIKDYFTSIKAVDSKSSLKNIHYTKDGKEYKLSLINDIYFSNNNLAGTRYVLKNNVLTGTKFGDYMNEFGDDDDTGYVINSGKGSDYILGSRGNDTINASVGNDDLFGGAGNDILNGGKGINTYHFSTTSHGNDTIKLTKGETANIKLENNTDASNILYEIDDKNNAKIYFDRTSENTTTAELIGFAAKDITKAANIIFNDGSSTNLKTDIQWEKTISKNYNGSYLSEHIIATSASEQLKKGKHVDLVIKGGKGNDTIESSNFADKITGGVGQNTIKYTSLAQLKGDKIYLTKGENAIIDLSNLNTTATYNVVGKNLEVTADENTFTIMNFGTKDVTNNKTKKKSDTSSVILIDETGEVDLRTAVVNSSKGTWHNDFIDKSGYTLYTDKKKTIVQTNTAKKGLTINGGAGTDEIIGSNYSDTIKAGTGTGDNLEGGTGNDKLYASTTKGSSTTFNFKAGDGADIVYSGKGDDILQFNDISISSLSFEQGTKKNNKDLIIKYGENDSVTVKDYYTVNKKGQITGVNSKNSIKKIVTTTGTFALSDINQINNYILNATGDVPTDSNNTTNDLIIATGTGNQHVYGNAGNDVIYASNNAQKNYLYGNDGDDIFYIAKNRFTQIYTGKGNDIIHAEDLSEVAPITNEYINYYYLDNGSNTLYLGKRGVKSLTVSAHGGDDTIYLSTEDAKNGLGNTHFYLASDSTKEGGHDTFIYQNGYTDGNRDVLVLDAIKYDDIIATRAKGSNDLVLRYGNDSDITFKDYFKSGNENFGKSLLIKTAENTNYILESLVADKGIVAQIKGLKGTKSNDYIIGTDKSETINANAGDDAIKPYGGNDKINLGAGNDLVLAGDGNKTITAVSGNNVISLGSGNNSVTTGTGSDRINSGTGSNTITFISNDIGSNEYKYGGGTDTLVFEGAELNDMYFDTTTSKPAINSGYNTVKLSGLDNYTDGVTIKDSTGATSTIFDMHTHAGNQYSSAGQEITTSVGNDIIYTGLGNDVINAGSGDNTIHLSRKVGSGNNNEYTYANGTDTFVLDYNEDFSKFSMQKSDSDLIIGYDGDFIDNTLVIKNYYTNENINESISFKAGDTTKTLKDLLDEIGLTEPIQGTDGNDNLGDSSASKSQYIYGMAGDDTIIGGSGKDYINGGSGNDSMSGGANNDIYEIDESDWGNDKDIINDTAGTDTLKINTTSDKINLFFDVTLKKEGAIVLTDGINAQYTSGNDLYINSDSNYTYENATDYTGVKIENYFNDGKIENIQIPSGTGNDYKNAIDTNIMSKVAQAVANWLNTYNFDSVNDVLTRGTDIQKANVIGLFKPITGTGYLYGTDDHNLIIATGTGNPYVYGNAGNDVIYASNNAQKNYLYGDDGDDIFYIAKNCFTKIYTGAGNDIIHAEDLSEVEPITNEYINYYTLGSGSNTLYLGKRGAKSLTVSAGSGDDTIYLSTEDAKNGKGESHFYLLSGSAKEGGHDTFIYQNGYTDGYKDIIYMQTINYNDIIATRTQESDDLVLRYGVDSDITFKDYFQAGNENFGRSLYIRTKDVSGALADFINNKVYNYITGDSETITGTSDNDYIKVSSVNDIIINDPNGNDYYNLTFDSNRTITDTAGNDTLILAAKKEDISLLFNVKQDGTFADGNDKLTFTSNEKAVVINDFDSIETIKTSDGYYLTTTQLNSLQSTVAGWLGSDSRDYADVSAALTSSDKDALITYITEQTNWQSA